ADPRSERRHRLPRGHAHARPRSVAHAGQVGRRASRARGRPAPDPGRALGRAADPAAVRTPAGVPAAPARDLPRRRAHRARGPARPRAREGRHHRGFRPPHAGGRAPARRAARRDAAGGALGSLAPRPERDGAPVSARVAVLGAGSWGTTFGKILAGGGARVTMWARRPELAREIDEAKRNSRYLPGINLPRTMRATHDIARALEGADQVYVSVPSKSARDTLKQI